MTADGGLASEAEAGEKHVRVFITYMHDSEEHKQQVLQFATLLRQDAVDARLDRWAEPERQDWYTWMIREVKAAEYVIVIASPEYKRVADGDVPVGSRHGGKEEAAILRDFLQSDREVWLKKLLPVVLPGHTTTEIPVFLQPYSADHYTLDRISSTGVEKVLRVLYSISEYVPPPLGSPSATVNKLKASRPPAATGGFDDEEPGTAASSRTSDASQQRRDADSTIDVVAAHTRNADGMWHSLGEHSRSTGRLSAHFADPWGAASLAEALGLFHDAGKAHLQWQRRLREVEGTGHSVGEHERLGARLLKPAVQHAAMAILGHHRGLGNVAGLRKVVKAQETEVETEARERFFAEVPEAREYLNGESLIPPAWRDDQLLYEMGLRMTFSALVDADRLDTAAHREGRPVEVSGPAEMGELVARYETRRRELLDSDAAPKTEERIAGVRHEVYVSAVDGAQRKPGFHRLAAPTGSGKTLAQGAFALHHAARWSKRRVVVAMPFITVTEQNAQVYRDLLDPDDVHPVVLEHHSQVQAADADESDRAQWARLAVENWDAPFVLTTTVQLFESLFGRTPTQVRKLHRLANSVLVLDEVQALPPSLLLPILDGLRLLVEHFGVTVLLTSATQPAFQSLSVWRNVDPKDLIDDVPGLFERARRVHYEWRLDPRPSFGEVADEVGRLTQALVIVNSTKDARDVYRLLRSQREDVWHLSSRMYPRHRSRVLREVCARLEQGESVVLVTTQLVEAGVDISFPVVWRAMAPADSLQQAAGRSGRHGGAHGKVVVFDPVDGHAPGEYATRVGLTRHHFGPGLADPDCGATLKTYYEELYSRLRLDAPQSGGARGRNAGATIQEHRRALDYRSVVEGPSRNAGAKNGGADSSKAFRMVSQNTVPVVIVDDEDPEADRLRGLLAQLAEGEGKPTEIARALQPWTVPLPVGKAHSDLGQERLERLGGDLHRWRGNYGRDVGIDDEEFVRVSKE